MQKKVFAFILVFGVISTLNVFSQTTGGENISSSVKFQSFGPRSYMTLRGGIGNIGNLVYEAGFAPSLMVTTKKLPNWGIELTPQIIIRMYDQYSHPVRTPSYMPMGTVFYHAQKITDHRRDLFAFLTLGHHSNGQDGLLFQSDSVTINTHDGSFANNYIKGGIILSYPEKKILTPVSYMRLAASYHRVRPPELRAMYGYARLFADVESVLNLSKEKGNIFTDKKTESKLIGTLNLTWLASDMVDTKPIDLKRLIVSYTLSYQPSFFRYISVFARGYYGQDYYNINFNSTLKVIQFGFSVKDLHF
jgi:hypothetical protein